MSAFTFYTMKKSILLALSFAFGLSLSAQTPTLTKDINTDYLSSNAESFHVHGKFMYFVAQDNDLTGLELWRTDGTDSGTSFVKDIYPGTRSSGVSNYASVGNILFFTANNGSHGVELWKTDGTDSGTVMVKDIRSGSIGSNPYQLTPLGDKLLFTATHDSSGIELWVSDGTDSGTVLVKDIRLGQLSSGIGHMFAWGDTLLFTATDGSKGEELWMSDGTESGTKLIKDIRSGSFSSGINYFVEYKGRVYFSANNGTDGSEMWVTDGSDTGTKMAYNYATAAKSHGPTYMVVNQGYIYYAGVDSAKGYELMQTDGSLSGTKVVKDLDPFGSSGPQNLTVVGDRIFFLADAGKGKELYVSDGTSAGTKLTRDLYPIQTDGFIRHMTVLDSTLYFVAHQSPNYQDFELYSVPKGSTYPTRVIDIVPGGVASNPADLTAFNGKLFFSVNDQKHGKEIWTSTPSKTAIFLDLYSGTKSAGIVAMGPTKGGVLFNAIDDDGDHLWKSTGSEAGTVNMNMKSRFTANASPRMFYQGGKYTYFTAKKSLQEYLYLTDGTLQGIDDIYRGLNTETIKEMTQVGNSLYFTKRGSSTSEFLYRSTDGNYGIKVKTINPSRLGDKVYNLTEYKGMVFFSAYEQANYGQELFKSDGTSSGTVLVKDLVSGRSGSNPSNLTVLDSSLIFTTGGTTSWSTLWITDGTSANTSSIKTGISGKAQNGSSNFVSLGKQVFFAANDGSNGSELWVSDGTSAGTKMLKDIWVGSSSSNPEQMFVHDSTLYFVANDSVHGAELWMSDGTASGTKMLVDLNPGTASASISELTSARDVLYFAGDNGVNGTELWKSDGTSAGTKMIGETFPGARGSDPALLTLSADTLYYVANHPEYGQELFWIYTQCMVANFEASSACVGSEITFTNKSDALGSTISSYLWDFGNGDTAQVQHPRYTYQKDSTYLVHLTITNTDGCSLETSKEITVEPLPVASFTVNNDTQCIGGNSFTFTNTSTPATGVSYAWDFNDGKNSNLKSPSHTYSIASTYKVQLFVTLSDACKDTASTLVTTLPRPSAINIVGNATSKSAIDSYEVKNTPGSSYAWSITFGKVFSGAGTNKVRVEWDKDINTAFVKVIETNSAGCKGSEANLRVTVDVVGISEKTWLSGISLAPNPSNGIVELNNDEYVHYPNYGVVVFNQLGQKILSQTISEKRAILDLSNPLNSAGIYVIRFEDENGQFLGSKRIVIH